MRNVPKYTNQELLSLIQTLDGMGDRVAPSMRRMLDALGPEAKAVMTCGGPCFPSSVAVATGQNLEAVCDKMHSVYKYASVLEGTDMSTAECERIPEVLKAAIQGTRKAVTPRKDLRGGTLAAAIKEGGTFVAVVAGGAHAVCVKRGKLYDTAGRTARQRVRFIWEVL